MKKTIIQFAALLAALTIHTTGVDASERWTKAQAQAWGQANPWFCGFNYIPANAINYTAMWTRRVSRPKLMERELALAEETGLNCARVRASVRRLCRKSETFHQSVRQILEICDRHRIKAMPIFFDDCVFGANADPVTGPQPEPLKGWYAWAWSPSPGHTMVIDERTHPLLETYVKEIMTRFGQDDRIFVWDLYNEPTNSGLGDRSLPLLKSVVKWAREVDVKQPITSAYGAATRG